MTVETPDGKGVRLGDVADVRIAPAPTTSEHESVQRYLDVVADVAGRDVGDVLAEVRAELPKIEFPLEYHAEVIEPADGGSARQAWILAIAAALLVFPLQVRSGAGGGRRIAPAPSCSRSPVALRRPRSQAASCRWSVAGFVATSPGASTTALMDAARARRLATAMPIHRASPDAAADRPRRS
jgi:hypothetical protein